MSLLKGAIHTCILVWLVCVDCVLAECEAGHATCHELVGTASWCQSKVNTCHGNPRIKCYCDSTTTIRPAENPRSANSYRDHAKCRHEVGRHSWCKENFTCHGGPHVFCGGEASALSPSPAASATVKPSTTIQTTVAAPTSTPVLTGHALCQSHKASSWCKEDGTCHNLPEIRCGSALSPSLASSTTMKPSTLTQTFSGVPTDIPILTGHALCKSHKASSWCKEDGTCHNLPEVHCGPTKSKMNRVLPTAFPDKYVHGEADERRVHPTPSADVYEAPKGSRPFVLWTEWPTMVPLKDWKAYFDKLLQFVRENCAGIQVTRLVMRILHPEFQQHHGHLWQVAHQSSFFKDFMIHLPPNVEVSMYPYLKDAHAVGNWTKHTGVPVPLEATFKFVKMWNDFLARNHVSHRIRGLVTDYEDGDNFRHHMVHLASYKRRYSSHGQPSLRFGIAIGYDSAGKIKSYGPEVDEVFLEMYDWYVEGTKPPIPVEAHNSALNNPAEFLAMLDKDVWKSHIPSYSRYPSIIFLWSLQNRISNDCLYPDRNTSCGERVDFGSWTPTAFHSFLDMVKEKYPVFGGDRQHGLFQFSYMPNSWATCPE